MITGDDIARIEAVLMCKVIKKNHGNMYYWFFYIEEARYLFPSIIRKPFSECLKCMSSVFGTAIWVATNSLYNNFSWTDNKIWALFFYWFIFVVVLTVLNGIVHKKTY